MKMKFLNIILIISFHQVNGVSYSIPAHLIPCYRKSYQDQLNKPPLNIQLLIELIRKFEFKKQNAINMRMFTTSLLHSTRYDGVMYTPGLPETEFTIPYRANGKQFYKFKLLVDYMISGKPELILDELDSVKDLCILHEIISSTTQIYPGRDGNLCAKMKDVTYKGVDDLLQDCCCFVEGGVVNTKWGVISPGHIIAGVAAALQEMSMEMQELVPIIQKKSNQTKNNFEYTGSINNVRIATIAGDLGELTLQQAFHKPQFGNYGLWNDTLLPRIYYLPDIRYEMTSAELLGGIDGAIFAENIKIWRSTIRRTRLSQLIDMYYSKRGIVFDNAYRACDRKSNLRRILEKYNLTEDTYKAANLLNEVSDLTWNPEPTSLLKYAEVVTAGFQKEAESQTTKYSDCNIQTYQVQPLEVLTIFDESWTRYEIEVFLGPLTEAIDLGFYGSSLGIINSESATWFTNVTDSLVQLYDDIYQSKHMSENMAKPTIKTNEEAGEEEDEEEEEEKVPEISNSSY
ncbi:hypothetical protein FQA39_LY17775 [Lamprigera yunnana]|nr:hypothetical protein FQA39_LY17775 [Lamprigera yunnana]